MFIKRRMQWVQAGLMAIYLSGQVSLAWAGVNAHEMDELQGAHRSYQSPGSFAEVDFEGGYDLDDLIRYALANNPSVKAQFYKWKAAVHQIDQAVSLDDPQFSFKWFIDNVETRVGPQEEMYGISQKIPFPGKLSARGQRALAHSRMEHAKLRQMRLEAESEVKKGFYEYWYLSRAIRVTEENQSIMERLEQVAQSKYKTNSAKNQDLLKAQVELGKLVNELMTLKDYRDPVVANLNAVLNRAPDAPLGWPTDVDYQETEFNPELVHRLLLEHSPELAAAVEKISQKHEELKLAELDYLPDVTAGVDYIRIGEGPLQVPDNGEDAIAVTFKVNLPVWLAKQNAQLDEAKSMKLSAEDSKQSLENRLRSRTEMFLYQLDDAARQVRLFRDALIPKAEQSLAASETGYKSGEIGFIELIDSERVLLGFQLAYYRAVTNYEKSLAELESVVGITLREGDVS